jgi:hypothetical protein
LGNHNSARLIHDRDGEVQTGFGALNRFAMCVNPEWLLSGLQHRNVKGIIGITRLVGTYG